MSNGRYKVAKGRFKPGGRFNAELLYDDMHRLGWRASDLAKRSRVSNQTVSRFFQQKAENPRTVKKLAKALGHDVQRYLITSARAVA